MMRRRALAGALAVVGVALVARALVPRKRVRKPPIVRVFGLVALASFDWDPISWVKDIGGFVVRSFNDVKLFVLTIVGDAIHGVYDALNAAVDAVDDALSDVQNGLASFGSWIDSEADRIGSWVDHWWDLTWGWVQSTVQGWIADLRNWTVDAIAAAASFLYAAIHVVEQAADTLYRDVIAPILSWVAGAAQWFAHMIESWWDGIYNDVIKPIGDLLDQAWQYAQVAYHFVTVVWVDVWKVLDAAWGWLVWFAEHTFDDLESLGSDLGHDASRSTLLGLARADESVVAGFADAVERILG
jgi:hypothetical protein